ncbi:MAG: energy transducer TonB [Spirochaetaceae bacterium]|nr:MAG: energy transducer TonB [Spirochaetaceae bacterium]
MHSFGDYIKPAFFSLIIISVVLWLPLSFAGEVVMAEGGGDLGFRLVNYQVPAEARQSQEAQAAAAEQLVASHASADQDVEAAQELEAAQAVAPEAPKAPEVNAAASGAGASTAEAVFDYVPDYSRNKRPVYPVAAIRMGQQGSVGLILHLDHAGNVADVVVDASSGYELLDRAAVQAAGEWLFPDGASSGFRMVRTRIRFVLE